jgi:hypothetical protein
MLSINSLGVLEIKFFFPLKPLNQYLIICYFPRAYYKPVNPRHTISLLQSYTVNILYTTCRIYNSMQNFLVYRCKTVVVKVSTIFITVFPKDQSISIVVVIFKVPLEKYWKLLKYVGNKAMCFVNYFCNTH